MGNPFSRCCVNKKVDERKTNGDARDRKINERAGRSESRRYSRNKNEGTTIISNKVEIGTCKLSIGQNARNVTINHLGENKSKTTTKSIAKDGHQERKDIFTSRYTKTSAANLENRTFDSVSAGNFIDNRNVHIMDYIYFIQELETFSHSVCQIRFPGGTGTGFRVGSKYIMTAYHVVKGILAASYQRLGSNDHDIIDSLQNSSVYCAFEYFKNNEPEKERKYRFKPTIPFKNEETDTAIIELVDNLDGTPMPPPFELFGFPDLTGRFTLMGHEGSIMKYNTVDQIINRDHHITLEDIQLVKEYNNTKTNESYEFPPYNTLTNENRILFHCKFSKGASGSPGMLVFENGSVVVVTMLLCGYPNWYYNERIDRQLRSDWPEEYCIEQGADMVKVGNIMRIENLQLYQDIFCRKQLPNPAL
ncbi:uncharacterized protein LOC123557304 [Mercenaria mercenaria]|uniref:uncharacterized protein LOC123557304 n=1 Tax=Mercenaria mercenaria TaxID=6596 RepID=UPI00234E4AF4|nr:uncharacterized protein LOC123557304 [Mercenaria mercenaria]